MGTQYRKAYRNRKPFKMKSRNKAAFSYTHKHKNQPAPNTKEGKTEMNKDIKDRAVSLLERMGFRTGDR